MSGFPLNSENQIRVDPRLLSRTEFTIFKDHRMYPKPDYLYYIKHNCTLHKYGLDKK